MCLEGCYQPWFKWLNIEVNCAHILLSTAVDNYSVWRCVSSNLSTWRAFILFFSSVILPLATVSLTKAPQWKSPILECLAKNRNMSYQVDWNRFRLNGRHQKHSTMVNKSNSFRPMVLPTSWAFAWLIRVKLWKVFWSWDCWLLIVGF